MIVSEVTLPLSDLEHRVLSLIFRPPAGPSPSRVVRLGLGDPSGIPADVYPVLALVQRLRAMLRWRTPALRSRRSAATASGRCWSRTERFVVDLEAKGHPSFRRTPGKEV